MARARSTPVRTAMTGKAAPSARLLREPAAPASLAETLTEQAYRLIEEQIVTLRLKPGDILSEQMLSASCRIGRTPIREALQRLAREGLVVILPRKGILVSDINPSSCSSKCAASSSVCCAVPAPSGQRARSAIA
jgi:DNA-binding FadR family transcriptional regulator